MTTEVVLVRGALMIEIALRPFAFTIRRSGRRLVRSGGAWVADGTIRDHFIQLTEGVLAREERSPPSHGLRASITSVRSDEAQLDVLLHGGRRARLSIGIDGDVQILLALEADGDPLRLALDWDRRSEEHYVGLGVRHATQLDQAGRAIQLGADRRYTGPDCPPAGPGSRPPPADDTLKTCTGDQANPRPGPRAGTAATTLPPCSSRVMTRPAPMRS